MTNSQLIAIGILVATVALILWNVRGHPRGGDGSGNDYGPGPDRSDSYGGDSGGGSGDGD